MKIGSVFYHNDYFHPDTVGVRKPEDITDDMDLLVFWGGGDINPAIYGERNFASDSGSYERDSIEVEVMRSALGKVPILGVCRGAQLACAMLGGRLYQDVNNHGYTHHMVVADPLRRFADAPSIVTTSLHHQMMMPTKDMEVIATAPGISTRRRRYNSQAPMLHETDTGEHLDPEVIVHTDQKVLMVQGHPEYTPVDSPLTRFTVNLLKHFFGVNFK